MTTTAARSQRTIVREAGVRGVGFLGGSDVQLRFLPAEPDSGVVFLRADLPERPTVPAHIRHVVPRQRRTALQRGEATVELVEHVLAALAGLQIDNCLVEIDAPEPPGGDGSSQPFVEALLQAGAVEQNRPKEQFIIDQPISVQEGRASLTAYPGTGDRLVLSYNLDYGRNNPINAQSFFVELSPENFRGELADSRTFLLAEEAEELRRAGIGSRTTTADLLIFGPDGPIENQLRHADECARHKVLDMVGDLALLGKDLIGHVNAHRSGHQLNATLVRALIEQKENQENSRTSVEAAHALDICGIMHILPHRYPFLLIDRALAIEANRRAVALKNVTCNEPFFQGHWPNKPVMPGVLILEALAQTVGLLIAQQFDPKYHSAMIVAIDNVRIRRPVVPGDQLILEVNQYRVKSKIVDASGVARVGDQVVAEARLRFAVLKSEAEVI
jgi:UDP-3-O-[3-hydroxymyristoyl] N-acetylglucosamine deacetylase/3-hydroxyacyl-[acyl-carrier-protein] dehydratase